MKTLKIILTSIFAIIFIQINAQNYDSDTFNYEFYTGTWEHKTPTEHFILKTWERTYSISNSIQFTVLVGTFKFTKYGFTVYDYLNHYKDENSSFVSFSIIKYLSEERKQPILSIKYSDPVTEYDTTTLPHESILTVVSTNPAKLSWHIVPCYDDQRIRLAPGETGFTIPSDMILTKVEE